MKTTALMFLLAAGALSASPAAPGEAGHSCCAAREDKTATAQPARFTDKSIYQLDATWTNDYGAAVKLASLQGRPQIITMFFANCAYACPLLVHQMQQVEAALTPALRDKIGFTLVSFDTERDTPAALHQYRAGRSLDAKRWTLLRGSPDDVLDLAALLNVKFKKDAQGEFQHSNVITLLNAQGEIVFQQLGLNADPQELIRQASLLAGHAGQQLLSRTEPRDPVVR